MRGWLLIRQRGKAALARTAAHRAEVRRERIRFTATGGSRNLRRACLVTAIAMGSPGNQREPQDAAGGEQEDDKKTDHRERLLRTVMSDKRPYLLELFQSVLEGPRRGGARDRGETKHNANQAAFLACTG